MVNFSRRRLFAGLGALGAAGGLGFYQSGPHRYYDGPVSEHFDGVRFLDRRHGMPPKSTGEVLRWYSERERSPWPAWHASPFSDRPPRRVDDRTWRISYVGHASLLLQASGLNILIDPVWSERASPFSFVGPKRVNDPGVAFDALPPIDIVLISHNHYDHLDATTLSALATPHRPRLVTPLGNDTIIRSHDDTIAAEAHDWGARVELGRGVAVTLAPARHWSARGLLDRNKALWAAFVIETPTGRIFHVADSGYGDGHYFKSARKTHGPFRLAILPVGAYEPRWFMRDQHMNPADAVQAFRDLGADLALGHHYGTFQLTDEAIDAPVQALAAARRAASLTPEQFRLLRPGEVWEV
ncbi:MAG TPA: MBL fold metallo-hydrolase [Xanthobacteraceae bacterium]|nr:MBL fold metallo-hydrolase [Xanthobacteraceae bacterium]